MNRKKMVRSLGASTCAILIFVMAACGGGGGGSAFSGGGTSGGTGSGTSGPPALVITTTSVPDAVVNVAYQQALAASGGTAPYTWSPIDPFPQGLTLNAATGTITGTPAYQGNFGIDVRVTDSGSPQRVASVFLALSIEPQLVISTISLPPAHTSAPYDAVVTAVPSVDATSWKVSSGSLPPGLQLTNPTSSSIEITGTPTQVGSFPITLQVQDMHSTPQAVQQSYTLMVDNALAIATLKLGSAVANANYSVNVQAVNGTPPYQWTAVGLPAALAIDSNTGTISGVPYAWGTYQPTISVSDSAGHTASQTLGLNVISALGIPNWGNQSPVIGANFTFAFNAFGGQYPYTWSIVSGGLPPGLSFNPAVPLVFGVPTQLGTYNVIFQATDSGSPQQTAQLATTFTVVPPQLYIVGTLPAKWPLGVPVQWSSAIQGGTPPYHWSAASGSLPPGLSFDPNTGDVTGTPTTLGQYTFTLSASDSGSPQQTANSSFTANVTTPLGRNDTVAHATPVGDGSWLASISPYADPPDSSTPVPDHDYYKIIGSAGTVVKVWTSAQNSWWNNPLDTVLEIVDANGARLNTCRLPGDPSFYYNSPCLNDDIVQGTNRDSQLEIKVPGQGNTQTTFYAHVFDWRGDARPDMQYYLGIEGSVAPLMVSAPTYITYGGGYSAPAACPTGQSCLAQFTSTGGTPPLTWTLDSGSVPPGLAINTGNGNLSGTPTTKGTYTMVVRASDAASPPQTVTATYTLTVEAPPQITQTTLPNGYTGVPYNQSISVTGGTPPYQWSLNGYWWDSGLTFDAQTGTIRGTPSKSGTYDIFIGILDALGLGDNRDVTVTIDAGPFSFLGGTFPDARTNVFYVGNCTQPVGGTTPYTFTLVSGIVPPGLTLANNCSLAGTPTIPGTYILTLTATDSSSSPQSATANVTITVTP